MRTLAFDIGIKNLAWCCADLSGSTVFVKGWANENLITGGTGESDVEAAKCVTCSKKATYTFQDSKQYCVRHCPPLTPAFRDLSGTLLRKIPPMKVLRDIALSLKAEKSVLKTKVSLLEWLRTKVCMPIGPSVKTKKVELEALHDGIRKVVQTNSALFDTCTTILLENQPAYKNPVMKSVQMMLFATLRDLLPHRPPVRLVHAGRKTAVEDIEAGDAGYSERKSASETRVLQAFRSGSLRYTTKPADWFETQKKRSDLADCLCMCLDSFDAVKMRA